MSCNRPEAEMGCNGWCKDVLRRKNVLLDIIREKFANDCSDLEDITSDLNRIVDDIDYDDLKQITTELSDMLDRFEKYILLLSDKKCCCECDNKCCCE